MIKYESINKHKLSIFKNIFINNGTATAYYVLFPYNYRLMDFKSAERHIEKLHSAISTLYSSFGEIKISMFKLKNIVSKQEVINSIVKTIKMYKQDYSDFPEEYKGFIKDITRDFSILAINIDIKNSINIEEQKIGSILKDLFDNFVKTNFSTSVTDFDENALSSQNSRIGNMLARYAVPANEKLVMNIYINSVFPSYNLIYNNFIMDNKIPILSGIKQEITPYLGWFEMSNSGIVQFGGIPKTTYGCILTILEFPETIYSENFNIAVPGLHVNMHLIPKEIALRKFKRMRADIKQESEEVDSAGNLDSDVDEHEQSVQGAINDIRKGRIMTEVDANILVLADSKEVLDKKKKDIISRLSDLNIVCSIADNQAKTFVNSFIKNRPVSYYHIMDLQYALSFQLDQGVLVGDQDSNFAAPPIGIN